MVAMRSLVSSQLLQASEKGVSTDTLTHSGKGEFNDGHSFSFLWKCRKNGTAKLMLTFLLCLINSPPQSAILDDIPPFLQANYQGDSVASDEAYYDGRVAETTTCREVHWINWHRYIGPVGVDPYFQKTPFTTQVRFLSGYTAKVQRGHFIQGSQVQSGSLSQALTVIGMAITLSYDNNPIKVGGLTNLHQDQGQ